MLLERIFDMHISTVYLHSYSSTSPVSGHVDFDIEGTKIQVTFTDAECLAIHDLCVKAWERKQATIANDVLSSSPALPELPAPEPQEFAEYEPVSILPSEEVFF
jgi:hypothetical protein